jgi:transcriptional regulator with XRE-family HTH domain
MSTLSEAIAEEFKRILTERKLSVSAAARELRVTRQAFHNYLNGKSVPRHKTLGRAMDRWDFNLRIGGVTFDRNTSPSTFSPACRTAAAPALLAPELARTAPARLHRWRRLLPVPAPSRCWS